MAVRTILRLGHPVLRSRAERVDEDRLDDAPIQTLVDDLVDTLRASGGVGLAAPQVGEALQIFVYEVAPEVAPEIAPGSDAESAEEGAEAKVEEGAEADAEDSPGIPLRVLVNPMVEPHARELVYDWEGCLSIPGLRGLVPRYPEVKVQGLDRHGEAVSYVAQGFEARIVQHEFDHLNGVIFLDRMRDLHSLAFVEEWQEYLVPALQQGEKAAVG